MVEWYKQVPRDFDANMRYRLAIMRKAARNRSFRKAMIKACQDDILFFFNAFCFLYEPRERFFDDGRKKPHTIPFITWEHQDPAILAIRESLGKRDIGVEKSRGEGMSWILVLFAVHELLFQEMSSIGLVSKSELDVDNPQSSSSLFWKIDWELTKLPRWMVPPLGKPNQGGLVRNVSRHTLINERNGSNITGYAATADVASGGRAKWFGMDELAKFPRPADEEAMASTQHVTDSRFVVSTPKGMGGAYYKAMHDVGSNMVKIVVDWKENPSKNRGLYTFQNGLPKAVDPVKNPLPAHYDPPTRDVLNLFATLRNKGYKLEGVIRSPWYDDECNRMNATPKSIAQELDRDYGGSQHRAFGSEFYAAAQKKIRPPVVTGDFTYDPETLEGHFEENENGPLRLWVLPMPNGKLPEDNYVLAGDVATGLGGSHTSNSALIGFNSKKQQVLEFAQNTIVPEDFADLSVALAKWLYGAYLGWEQNGPGQPFTNQVLKREYYHVYRRTGYDKMGKKKEKRKVGWWTDDKTKPIMFGELSRGVKTGEISIYSKELLTETGEYTWENGLIVHNLSKHSEDGSSQGKAHGDRVIAASVGAMLLAEIVLRPLKEGDQQQEDLESLSRRKEIPKDTLAARMRERQQAREDAEGNGWDHRTNYDLALGYAGH